MERNIRSEHLIFKQIETSAFPRLYREIAADSYMRVQITLNKTNTGGIQLACVRSTNERGGIGTGFALPPFNPNALREVEDMLRSLGVKEELISQKITQLRQVGPNDLVKVDDLDVPDDVFRENGFVV
jgi:hypothetical protein